LKKQKRSKCHCVPSVRDSNSPSEQKERARRTSRYSKYGFRILKNYGKTVSFKAKRKPKRRTRVSF
ncbi:MAG: hypothetical protein ABH879_03220, partial [archaeon]